MGSFCSGLNFGVCVSGCQGISFCKVNGMFFSWKAMRFIRAKGDGVAEMRVRSGVVAMMNDDFLDELTGERSCCSVCEGNAAEPNKVSL